MTNIQVLLLAFLIGAVAGLRSMMAPAVVAWATHRRWLILHNTALGFMGSTVAVTVFTVAALIELFVDKLPSTPKRTARRGLIARTVTGGLTGAVIASAGAQPITLGVLLGVCGGLAGAYAGYEARRRVVRALKIPDFVYAVLEDAIAIVGGVLIVTRF